MLEWEKCAVLNIDLRYAILLLVGLYLTRRINDFERRIANIAIRDVNKCIRERNYRASPPVCDWWIGKRPAANVRAEPW